MWGREPAVVLGALGEVIRTVIPMLILFSVITWDDKQVAGVMLVVSVTMKFFEVLLTRSQVVAVQVADKQMEIAKASPVDRPTEQIIAQAKKETE